MVEKQQQHEIPRVYLKNFQGENLKPGQVWVYERSDGKKYPAGIDKIAKIKDRYTINLSDGTRSLAVEDALSLIENSSVSHLPKFIGGSELLNEERYELSAYFASMHLRTWPMGERFGQFFGELFAKVGEVSASNKDHFAQTMEELMRDKGSSFTEDEQEALRQSVLERSRGPVQVKREAALFPLTALPLVTRVFFDMNWTLLESASNEHFITSDNPVVLQNPITASSPLMGAGLAHKKSQVTLPLSPNYCWLGTWDSTWPASIQLSAKHTGYLNRARVVHANQRVFSHRDSDELVLLIKELSQERGNETESRVTVKRK